MALYLLRTAATRRVAHLHTAARGADPATLGTLPTATGGAAATTIPAFESSTGVSVCRKLMWGLQ